MRYTMASHLLKLNTQIVMLYVVVIVSILIMLVAWWVYRSSKPLSSTSLEMRTWGNGPCLEGDLPKLIWTFWHDDQPPELVQRCIQNWRKQNPDYQITLVTAATLSDYVDAVPSSLTAVHVTKQADWLRMALLEKYGGVWLDASIILAQPLEQWLRPHFTEHKASFVGFYLQRHATESEYPLIENWFMAAKPGDAFIRDWLHLFTTEVINSGTESYLNKLRQAGQLQRFCQGFTTPEYHTMHVAGQQLLHQNNATECYRLNLLRAEDYGFKLQAASQWRRRRLYWRLLVRCDEHLPPLIKLRGGERRKLDFYLRHNLYGKNSLFARLLYNDK